MLSRRISKVIMRLQFTKHSKRLTFSAVEENPHTMSTATKDRSIHKLAMISDPSVLIEQGTLTLYLEQTEDGKFSISLSSRTRTFVQVPLKKSILKSRTTHDGSSCRKKKRKQKKKKNKQKDDFYDWASVLTEAASSRESDSCDSEEKRNGKRKKKKKRQKEKAKNASRSSDGSQKKKTKKGSRSSRKSKSIKTFESQATSSICSLQETFTNSENYDSLPVTPRRSKIKPNSITRSSPGSSSSSTLSSVISLSDLRSSMSWEKRRQNLTRSSEGSILVSAISLSNPSIVVQGYLLAKNHSKLEQILIGGAFVYKYSPEEQKMMQWERRLQLAGQRSSPVAGRVSSGTLEAPASSPRSEANSRPNKYQQIESTRPAPLNTKVADRSDQEEAVESISSHTSLVRRSEPTRGEVVRLQTLRQIEEWEAIDDHFFRGIPNSEGSADIADDIASTGGVASLVSSLSWGRASSFGGARVTGEHDLWSFAPEEGDERDDTMDRTRHVRFALPMPRVKTIFGALPLKKRSKGSLPSRVRTFWTGGTIPTS